ncbi:MAG TPA: hypothetical protein VG389_07100 [Myxococcota bacterium]|jgi:hypothetical protein|nr:hypothetical protein [Myxococcota bacterium]
MPGPRRAAPLAVAAVLLAGALVWARPAAAQYATVTANEKLKAARAAFEENKWVDAAAAAAAALEVPHNSLEEMVEIYRLKGMCEALLGKKAVAVETFKVLLAMSFTATVPPTEPPAVHAAFAAAHDWWRGKASGIVVEHDGVPAPFADAPILVSVGMIDPLDVIRKAALVYRNDKAKPWTRVVTDRRPGATRLELVIPASDVGAGLEVEYYVELLEEHEGVVARLGEARAPRSAFVPGLPPGMLRTTVDGKKKPTGGGGGGTVPLWAVGAGGGAAVLVAGLVLLLLPKSVDVHVISCIGTCE